MLCLVYWPQFSDWPQPHLVSSTAESRRAWFSCSGQDSCPKVPSSNRKHLPGGLCPSGKVHSKGSNSRRALFILQAWIGTHLSWTCRGFGFLLWKCILGRKEVGGRPCFPPPATSASISRKQPADHRERWQKELEASTKDEERNRLFPECLLTAVGQCNGPLASMTPC